MNDIFVEQLVKRKATASVILLRILVYAAVILLAVPFLFTKLFFITGPVAAVAAFFLARYLLARLNLEFEYALTNSELDIAMITGGKKRSDMLSVNVTDMEFAAPVSQDFSSEFQNSNIKTTYNASSSDSSEHRWFILFRKDGALCRLIFEPKEQIIQGIERYKPYIVHRSL